MKPYVVSSVCIAAGTIVTSLFVGCGDRQEKIAIDSGLQPVMPTTSTSVMPATTNEPADGVCDTDAEFVDMHWPVIQLAIASMDRAAVIRLLGDYRRLVIDYPNIPAWPAVDPYITEVISVTFNGYTVPECSPTFVDPRQPVDQQTCVWMFDRYVTVFDYIEHRTSIGDDTLDATYTWSKNTIRQMLHGRAVCDVVFPLSATRSLTVYMRPGDYDGDGHVTPADVEIVRAHIGELLTDDNRVYDYNNDGRINAGDLLQLRSTAR